MRKAKILNRVAVKFIKTNKLYEKIKYPMPITLASGLWYTV